MQSNNSSYVLKSATPTIISFDPGKNIKKPLPMSVLFNSVTQSCPTLCNPMNHSTSGLPVHHQLPEFTQTHVDQVSDAIQPSHPQSSPSPPAPNPSQHQGLFQRVNSSHEGYNILKMRNLYALEVENYFLNSKPRNQQIQLSSHVSDPKTLTTDIFERRQYIKTDRILLSHFILVLLIYFSLLSRPFCVIQP